MVSLHDEGSAVNKIWSIKRPTERSRCPRKAQDERHIISKAVVKTMWWLVAQRNKRKLLIKEYFDKVVNAFDVDAEFHHLVTVRMRCGSGERLGGLNGHVLVSLILQEERLGS